MEMTVSQVQGRVPVTVLCTHGDVDGSNFKDLMTQAQVIYDSGARHLILDLSETPFMSSSGLVALASVALTFQGAEPMDPEAGWSALHDLERHTRQGPQTNVKLLSPSPKVLRVLRSSTMDQFFEIYTNLDTALAAF